MLEFSSRQHDDLAEFVENEVQGLGYDLQAFEDTTLIFKNFTYTILVDLPMEHGDKYHVSTVHFTEEESSTERNKQFVTAKGLRGYFKRFAN